jgi:hypothetical protein
MLIDYQGVEPILADWFWKPIFQKNRKAFAAMASWK